MLVHGQEARHDLGRRDQPADTEPGEREAFDTPPTSNTLSAPTPARREGGVEQRRVDLVEQDPRAAQGRLLGERRQARRREHRAGGIRRRPTITRRV
jgi:hypothetical protein